ncbi:MAG TPA: hypothetical protein VHE78_02865 [Gemmatimonadaceae bacterium]|nr:hypothetical protein [Gemmatimonadaceae bacterium]
MHVSFTSASDTFASARDEYAAIWLHEGPKIIRAMEQVSGLRFDSPPYADTIIGAVIYEGVSNSGFREKPMMLRASYSTDTKKATLVHELGHRLQVGVARPEENEHELLFLWLYDVWVTLWGRAFADAQVVVERARHGPYPAAWDAAMALDAEGRARRWRSLRDRTAMWDALERSADSEAGWRAGQPVHHGLR